MTDIPSSSLHEADSHTPLEPPNLLVKVLAFSWLTSQSIPVRVSCPALGFEALLSRVKGEFEIGLNPLVSVDADWPMRSNKRESLDVLFPIEVWLGGCFSGSISWERREQSLSLMSEGVILGVLELETEILTNVMKWQKKKYLKLPKISPLEEDENIDRLAILSPKLSLPHNPCSPHPSPSRVRPPITPSALRFAYHELTAQLARVQSALIRAGKSNSILEAENKFLVRRRERALLLSDSDLPLDEFEMENMLATRRGWVKIYNLLNRAEFLFRAEQEKVVQGASVWEECMQSAKSVAALKKDLRRAQRALVRVNTELSECEPLGSTLGKEVSWQEEEIRKLEHRARGLAIEFSSVSLSPADLFDLEILPGENRVLAIRGAPTNPYDSRHMDLEILTRRELTLQRKLKEFLN